MRLARRWAARAGSAALMGPDLSGSLTGAGGVGGLLCLTRHERGVSPADSYWATSDLNGNVIGLSAVSTVRHALYEYNAFGSPVRVNEPEPELNPMRFSSKYTDVETNWLYYGFRYYSPELGRWLSRDPIEENGGINLYGMVGNDSVNHFDVLGMGKGKIVGYLAKRFGQQSVKKVTPIFTHKEAAQLFKKGSELMMKSRDDATKVARIAIDKKNLLRHKGHKLKTGKTGAPHYQDNTAPGKHIFWSTVLAGISASTASNLQGEDTGDQAGVELVEVYTNPYPGPSIANGLTATYWFGPDSVMSYLDWINPGELIAMGGDYGRELSREQEKELIGFSLTISECGKPAWTFGFDANGKLTSSAEWVDGKLQEQQISSFGDTIWLDVKEAAK
ncbi:MAG: hypothetical protein CJBNEKGG_04433 [Prosthecobacter sp.]|nr:hypothetical protein [Prosthecobacter sp.]